MHPRANSFARFSPGSNLSYRATDVSLYSAAPGRKIEPPASQVAPYSGLEAIKMQGAYISFIREISR